MHGQLSAEGCTIYRIAVSKPLALLHHFQIVFTTKPGPYDLN